MSLKSTVAVKDFQEALAKVRCLGSLVDKDNLSLRVEDPDLCLHSSGEVASISVRLLSLPDRETRSGEVSVPLAELSKFLGHIEGEVSLAEAEKTMSLSSTVSGETSKLRIPKVATKEVGIRLTANNPTTFPIPEEALEKLISVAFTAAPSFDRPSKSIQTGTVIRSDGTVLYVEAHQDFLMGVYKQEYKGGGPFTCVIPARVAKVLPKMKVTSVSISEDLITFKGNGVELEVAPIAQQAIELDRVLRKFIGKGTWSIPQAKLKGYVGIVRQALALGRSDRMVGFDLNPGVVSVYVSDKVRGSTKTVLTDPGYAGDAMRLLMNGAHLAEVLSCTESDTKVEFAGPGELVKVVGKDLTYALMSDYG